MTHGETFFGRTLEPIAGGKSGSVTIDGSPARQIEAFAGMVPDGFVLPPCSVSGVFRNGNAYIVTDNKGPVMAGRLDEGCLSLETVLKPGAGNGTR